jgi:hypothetical protein
MSSTITTDPGRRSRPRLRLLRDDHKARPCSGQDAPQPEPATVLVAGAQAAARAKMLLQLRELLPEGTPFVEADETWEVVAQAASSRLVVLTGDLGDLSARGLMRVLSRRHPLLPVISVGGCTDGAAAPEIGAASL